MSRFGYLFLKERDDEEGMMARKNQERLNKIGAGVHPEIEVVSLKGRIVPKTSLIKMYVRACKNVDIRLDHISCSEGLLAVHDVVFSGHWGEYFYGQELSCVFLGNEGFFMM